jgi:hypothetical protein
MKRQALMTAAVLLCAASMLVFGFWALFAPESFIDFVDYHPYNEHLTHDAGAFQIGIGMTLLFTLVWNDATLVVLAGFAVASGLHTLSHHLDRHIGGHSHDVPSLGLFTLVALIAIVARIPTRRTE